MVNRGGVTLTMIIYDFKFELNFFPMRQLINATLAVILLP